MDVSANSLLPLLKDGAIKKRYIHGEHTGHMGGFQFLTDGKHKFIWESQSGMEQFFDLSEDPFENCNLIHSKECESLIKEMRIKLIELLSSRDDGLSVDGKLISGFKAHPVGSNLSRLWTK